MPKGRRKKGIQKIREGCNNRMLSKSGLKANIWKNNEEKKKKNPPTGRHQPTRSPGNVQIEATFRNFDERMRGKELAMKNRKEKTALFQLKPPTFRFNSSTPTPSSSISQLVRELEDPVPKGQTIVAKAPNVKQNTGIVGNNRFSVFSDEPEEKPVHSSIPSLAPATFIFNAPTRLVGQTNSSTNDEDHDDL